MKNRLKIIRLERGYTQEELAGKANTVHETISRLETGKRRLTDKWVVLLSKILECHPGELFEPLPRNGDNLSKEERMAAQLVLGMTPDQRASWFSVGHSLAKQQQSMRRMAARNKS